MTNFDFLKNDPQFATFADAAIAADKVYHVDFTKRLKYVKVAV